MQLDALGKCKTIQMTLEATGTPRYFRKIENNSNYLRGRFIPRIH
jgi:hypothetical protein